MCSRYSSLELAFDTKELRTVCESETQAIKHYGNAIAEVLKRRLADLRAAKSINDLVVGCPRPIGKCEFIIDLCNDHFMIFRANHTTNPMMQDGKLDWAKVSRVKIVRLESDRV